MSFIKEPEILGLVEERHPQIYNREYDGISNSLSASKCLWNDNSYLSFVVNNNYNISIVSDSAQDNLTGAGVKTIRISGLIHSVIDGVNTYSDKFVDMDLNGTNIVNVTNGSFYRVLKIESIAFGSGGGNKNQGNIKVSITGNSSLIVNCMKQYDNISNSLIISPPSGNSIVLEEICINAYFHTATELIFKILKVDGSEIQFQKIYLNSNNSYLKFPIRKILTSGQTFYLEMNPLETIIGTNNISCILTATNLEDKKIGILNHSVNVYYPTPDPT